MHFPSRQFFTKYVFNIIIVSSSLLERFRNEIVNIFRTAELLIFHCKSRKIIFHPSEEFVTEIKCDFIFYKTDQSTETTKIIFLITGSVFALVFICLIVGIWMCKYRGVNFSIQYNKVRRIERHYYDFR